MENNFDYQSVPKAYTHCFNTACVKSGECLHHLVAMNSTSQHITLHIVNPKCIPKDTSTCPFFKTIKKVRLAWGVTHLFDDIPHKTAKTLRKKIIGYFGKTTYYRLYRQELGIMPDDQNYIQGGIQAAWHFRWTCF